MFTTGCYDDKSSLRTLSIEEVVINAAGIPDILSIGYLEELKLAPEISMAGKSDDNGLQYEWAITESSYTDDAEYEIVGTEKKLLTVVNRPVSSTPYTVKLTVTDVDNGGLQYFKTWKMYVRSTFVDGLLVSDTPEGQTSDFTYIKNSTLTLNYTEEERIYRNILAQSTGTPYEGLLSSLTYEVQGNTTGTLAHVNQVWALTPEGYCTRFDCVDFSVNGNTDSQSLLVYKPEGFKFIRFFKGAFTFFAVTNNGIYSFVITSNIFGWFDPLIKDVEISGNVVAANSSTYIIDNHTVLLDKRDGKFRSYSDYSSFAKYETYRANSVFDPNAMQDKTAVAAGIAEDAGTSAFLLKDNNTGEYDIYTLTQYRSAEQPASAGNRYAIPPAGKNILDRAVSIFFAQKDLVLYVATGEGVYAITYGSGNTAVVNETARFSQAGEKITKAKLYQQGHYVNDIASLSGGNHNITELPWNNKAVIVSTQTDEFEGKVYVIPLSQPGTGTMDPSQALVYEGFGKILDVITIGY